MDGEDQTAQDARAYKLWKTLDTRNEGQLNLDGLKKGLSNINHRVYQHVLLRSFLIPYSSQECRLPSPRRHESCGYE